MSLDNIQHQLPQSWWWIAQSLDAVHSGIESVEMTKHSLSHVCDALVRSLAEPEHENRSHFPWVLDLVARAIRNAIRANRFARIIRNCNPYFYNASGRFALITRISDSRKSPDSRESCELIRANHATKVLDVYLDWLASSVMQESPSSPVSFGSF